MVQSSDKSISNAYVIEHVKLEFEDFLPWKEILDEWKILIEERKTLRLEEKNNCKPSKIEQKIVEQEKEHWFKVIDDYEDD